MGEVPGGDRADHARWLPPDLSVRGHTDRHPLTQVDTPAVVGLCKVRPVAEVFDWDVELRARRQERRRSRLGGGQCSQRLAPFCESVSELAQTASPQGCVRRPAAAVERPAGCVDRCFHVGRCRVGGETEHILGRRIDRGERGGSGGRAQLAVDQQHVQAVRQVRRFHQRSQSFTGALPAG
ncbi:MAG: hypothetical protein V9E94_15760 [Microthrixaceae bacterium]